MGRRGGGDGIWKNFFLVNDIFSLKIFGETSFLIPPLNMPLLYFEGGGGGLDLKAEEVSLPSWGLLCYFFSPVGCRHLPYEC